MLHEGEAVIPAESNTGVGGASGGGSSVSINVSAIDAQSFASMLRNNQSALTIALKNVLRTNPSLIPQATGY